MTDYSVVLPVYNEEESLDPLVKEIREQMDKLNRSYEIIFVDDCSSDRSISIMEGYKKQNPERITLIKLPKRSGQTFAMRKGLEAVRGKIAFTLDADLQNDPADIPLLLEK